MATVRLTKKGTTLIALLGLIVIGAIVGFILWRVNQDANLGNEDSNAGLNLCTGSLGSGAYCNKYGNPAANKMWACKAVSFADSGLDTQTEYNNCIEYNYLTGCYQCLQVPINDGDDRCYLAAPNTWAACGCNTGVCDRECRKDLSPTKTYNTYSMKCDACQQLFTCECRYEETNVCGDKADGTTGQGAITSPASGTRFNPGQTVTIQANAVDKDGVKDPVLTVDGTALPATTCTVGTKSGDNNPITCTYTIPTSALTGAMNFALSWKDSKGASGSLCQSTLSVNVTPTLVCNSTCTPSATNPCPTGLECLSVSGNYRCVNPACPNIPVADNCLCSTGLRSVKNSAVQCIITEDPERPMARVNYSIQITFTSNDAQVTSRTLTSVIDRPQNIQSSWLVAGSISPTGTTTVESNMLTSVIWSNVTIQAGQTISLTYALLIPYEGFGTYVNTVTGYENDTSVFEVSKSTYVGCTPQTGLFDEPAGKVGLAIILVLIGLVYFSYDGVEKGIKKAYIRVSNSEDSSDSERFTRFEKRTLRKRTEKS